MNLYSTKIKNLFFNSKEEYHIYLLFFITLGSKFIIFDIIWCSLTSFQPFSWIEYYSNKFLIILLFMLPFICFNLRKTYFLLFLVTDLFLIANLLYLRTYNTAIPLSSYALLSNLSDFTASVTDSFRWPDLYFPFSTFLLIILYPYQKCASTGPFIKHLPYIYRYLILVVLYSLLSWSIIYFKGGFISCYERLLRVNTYACGTPVYTLFGSLFYQYKSKDIPYTSEIQQEINDWLDRKQPSYKLSEPDTPEDCLIILVESLESWVLERKVEGIEITPNLNALIREKNTLYAPKVQTQVKDGRSIDGQLLLHTGLLPIQNGTYSIKYPHSYYPSLIKALKEKRPTKAVCMIIDKKSVWNAQVIEPALGFDTLLHKNDYIQDERIGNKRRLSDGSFLRQCIRKMKSRDICPDSAHFFIQCVTVTGHSPFYLPKQMRRITFSEKIPQRMKDYMTVTNYTDHAIGKFIKTIRSIPRFANMMIVITGDHEGLADSRAHLCHAPGAEGIVSPYQFTPFIVLNSPVALRYEKIMGQIDMYPTLLNLLGLDDYAWNGLGQSILDPRKKAFAVTRDLNILSEEDSLSYQEAEFARKAWKISDYIIRYDYLSHIPSFSNEKIP